MLNLNTDSTKTRLEYQLKQQSLTIERILNLWQLPAIVTGGNVEPDWIQFEFNRPPFPLLGDIDTDALRQELQEALRVDEAQWVRTDSGLKLAVRRHRIPVPLLDVLLTLPNPVLYETVLGLAENGVSLHWQLNHPDSRHAIATGAPGAGLVDLLCSQAMALALGHTTQQLRLLLLDGSDKATSTQPVPSLSRYSGQATSPLVPLLDLPHTLRLAAGDEAVSLLIRLGHRLLNGQAQPTVVQPRLVSLPISNMPATANGHSNGRCHPHAASHFSVNEADHTNCHSLPPTPYAPTPTPHLVVICHRLDRLLERQPKLTRLLPLLLNRHVPSTGSGQVPSTGPVPSLSRYSAQVPPFHLLATVRPPAFGRWPVLGQFPTRLVGCMPDTASAAQATGRPHSQAERLLGGGDFLAIAAGLFVHFQAASLDPYEWDYCLEKLGNRERGVGDRERGMGHGQWTDSSPTPQPLTNALGSA
jgi:hypothetical protein